MRQAAIEEPGIRNQMLLFRAARRLDRKSNTLKADLEARGFVVTGVGRSRRAFIADLATLQRMEIEEAREAQRQAGAVS